MTFLEDKQLPLNNNNLQDKELIIWVKAKLILNPTNIIKMTVLYQDYSDYHKNHAFLSLPLKSKTFATKLKQIFNEKEYKQRVRFIYHNKSQVEGINLKID